MKFTDLQSLKIDESFSNRVRLLVYGWPFLSSVEAEIISFCQRKQPFVFLAFYVHPLTFEGGSPSIFDE